MRAEIVSTTRPSLLRLAGFACVAAGAALTGIGATRPWATVGFTGDRRGAADLAVHGTDVWEGKVVLLAAAVALFAVLAMRLARSGETRRGLAVFVVALGLGCVSLAVLDAARAESRFGGTGGQDRLAEALAAEVELPEDVVRGQLEELIAGDLRVDVEPGLWLSAAGGLVLAAGGVLSLALVRR